MSTLYFHTDNIVLDSSMHIYIYVRILMILLYLSWAPKCHPLPLLVSNEITIVIYNIDL